MSSFYERLSINLLAEFHFWITFNIKSGVKVFDMYNELSLVGKEMDRRGIKSTEELYEYRLMKK